MIQRETISRSNKCAQAHGQKTQSCQGARDLLNPDPRRHGPTAAG
ncbi:hypothetical protein SynM161_02209 [Synechococcus sp. M16.1]|nr:hypothetical protein SynM161_02209 [Synechococcus sp. M16.1]